MINKSSLWVALLSTSLASCAGAGDDVCSRAARHLEACAGVTLPEPDTCDANMALRVLDTKCAELGAVRGTSSLFAQLFNWGGPSNSDFPGVDWLGVETDFWGAWTDMHAPPDRPGWATDGWGNDSCLDATYGGHCEGNVVVFCEMGAKSWLFCPDHMVCRDGIQAECVPK
jgi:hypothetical protein